MVLVHIGFVVLFIGAVTYQIVARRVFMKRLEDTQERNIKEAVNQIIDTVTDTSGQVLRNAKELNGYASSLSELAAGVIGSMDHVDRTARLRENGARSSKAAIQGMLDEMNAIAETASGAYGLSEEVAREADNGNASIQTTVKQMQAMSRSVHDSAATVKLLGERSKEIDDITGIIAV